MDTERHNAQQREWRKRIRRRAELARRAEAATDPDILMYRYEKARRAARQLSD